MKKFLAVLMALAMLISLAACANAPEEPTDPVDETVSITLWTYPIGSWSKSETVDTFIAAFNAKYPNIQVSVEYLDYTSGDDQVTSAIGAGTAPDIIFEGPERLVSNWGAKGLMVDLADLWDDEALADISAVSQSVVNACSYNGTYYEYPMCMTAHCMAINYEVFEQADALKYIDLENRTWTTENFKLALEAVANSGLVTETGVVYCGGQGGDQGTRALVNNLYSGKFTNAEHTAYTANSEENVKALESLKTWSDEGIIGYDAGAVASDELQLFANGSIAMSFCWNASNEANYASQVAFTPYAMTFPSDDNVPELCGGIWGFGIFNNNDEAKIQAAKTFIEFMCDDSIQGPVSVAATGFFPVRASYGNVYAGTENEARMAAYTSIMPFLGDYYNVTGGWAEQRTAWWNLLQQVFAGEDITASANAYAETVNANIG